jgi:hypothetical protein
MAAQSRDHISGRPDDGLVHPGRPISSSDGAQEKDLRQRPGSGGRVGMGRAVAAVGGGNALGSAAYDAAAAYLAGRKKEGSWPSST